MGEHLEALPLVSGPEVQVTDAFESQKRLVIVHDVIYLVLIPGTYPLPFEGNSETLDVTRLVSHFAVGYPMRRLRHFLSVHILYLVTASVADFKFFKSVDGVCSPEPKEPLAIGLVGNSVFDTAMQRLSRTLIIGRVI